MVSGLRYWLRLGAFFCIYIIAHLVLGLRKALTAAASRTRAGLEEPLFDLLHRLSR